MLCNGAKCYMRRQEPCQATPQNMAISPIPCHSAQNINTINTYAIPSFPLFVVRFYVAVGMVVCKYMILLYYYTHIRHPQYTVIHKHIYKSVQRKLEKPEFHKR
ncbi:hypothetical protein [Caudoviricetes sp.]|nr:hypothetical protein [Caudoviricetes sp.]